jgi:hypothetical protein
MMIADNHKDVAIIDFGISSVHEGNNTVIVTQTGMTPVYSAPEAYKNLFLASKLGHPYIKSSFIYILHDYFLNTKS